MTLATLNSDLITSKLHSDLLLMSDVISRPKVFLTLQNKTVSYENQNACLLDVLHDNNIFVEYQCRDGYCGSCRTKLVNGEVKYIKQPLAFIGENEILPCCCKPVTDIELAI